MTTYTFGAYDWRGNLMELKLSAKDQKEAAEIARNIFETSLRWINIDEGVFLIGIGEEDC